jgi:hypothetical protein
MSQSSKIDMFWQGYLSMLSEEDRKNAPALSMVKGNALVPTGFATIAISIHDGVVRSDVNQAKPCQLSFNVSVCSIHKVTHPNE